MGVLNVGLSADQLNKSITLKLIVIYSKKRIKIKSDISFKNDWFQGDKWTIVNQERDID